MRALANVRQTASPPPYEEPAEGWAVRFGSWLYRHRGATAVPFAAAAVWGARPDASGILAGSLLIVAGEALRVWAVSHIGAHSRGTTLRAPELVTTGPYALMRHPLYFGNGLLCLGLMLLSKAYVPWLPLFLIPAFLVQCVLFVRIEESFLSERFGDAWNAYARAVPSFLGAGGLDRLIRAMREGARWDPGVTSAALRIEWPTLRTLLGLVALILAWGLWRPLSF